MLTGNRRRSALIASILVFALIATACGGKSSSDKGGGSSQPSDAGKPVVGGQISYGLEAETSGGFCLSSAQLAISGIQVANTMYETLVVPDQKGDFVPFLASSVTPNSDSTQWTIKLRSGIKFHDGTPLNAEAVKKNLDAYRKGVLFQFVFPTVTDVVVVDDSTVQVNLQRPWTRFPVSLWSTGRLGMMAPAQIDSPDCQTKLIGTGPFKYESYSPNNSFVVVKNPDYWLKDKDGNKLPYLDKITFVPQPDAPARRQALETGQLQAMMTNSFVQVDALEKNSDIKLWREPKGRREVSHALLNVGPTSPFQNRNARLALGYAIDKKKLNEVTNLGKAELTNSLFDKDVIGYTQDTGLPQYNVNKAKDAVAKYKQETGKDLEFRLAITNDPETKQIAELAKEDAEKAGIKVNLVQVDQGRLIIAAIGNEFDAFWWRNYPGTDPDSDRVWFYSGNITNFNKINDPQIDNWFVQGAASNNDAEREQIYTDMNKHFGEEAYSLWGWYAQWVIATQKNVNGILGPNLPKEDGSIGDDKPYPIFAGWQLLSATYLSK